MKIIRYKNKELKFYLTNGVERSMSGWWWGALVYINGQCIGNIRHKHTWRKLL